MQVRQTPNETRLESGMSPAAILIAGPTAAGKSAFALQLAKRLDGTIINADSMQVYRELRLLTARPAPEDEANIPHRLYGHAPGSEAYSAARFAAEAAAVIAEERDSGRLPIVVGGTGLYFKALLEGLSPIPPIPEEVRAHWRGQARESEAGAMHDILKARDPAMAARLSPADKQRIVRALEVLEGTGRSLDEWQKIPGDPVLHASETMRLYITRDRDDLYRRCDERFDTILGAGAEAEAELIAGLALDPELPVMRAVGLRPLLALKRGELTREAAIEEAKADTRQYAKRQLTWAKSNMNTWKSIKTQEMERIIEEVVSNINTKG
jgi:tRNA dimethylallyltransferase